MTAFSLANPPRGIAGLRGREPIACAVTMGIKGPSGHPVDKDRFWILDSTPTNAEFKKSNGETYKAPVRAKHPSFAIFNEAPASRRLSIPAVLAHATVAEMFDDRRQAYRLPGISHPKKAPACIGNGVDAIRWTPDREDYMPIACPGERCPFTVAPNDRTPAPCKPTTRLLARFNWPVERITDPATGKVTERRLPNLPFKFISGGWNTAGAILGFFETFERNCRALGVDPLAVPLFGLPVLLTLTERTNPKSQSRFPTVSLQINGDADMLTWIEMQLRRREEVQALAVSGRPLLALTDPELNTPAELEADYSAISAHAGSIGGGR
jgi:hypothetical protein